MAARLALLVALRPGGTHQAWADALGVTRSHVTQLLAILEAPGHDAALRRWLEGESHTNGWGLYLYGDADAWEQADRLCLHLDARLGSSEPPTFIGGELAADTHAPWTSPQRAAVRARRHRARRR